MKFLKNIWIFIGLVALLLLVNRWYVGGFSKLEAKEQNMGAYMIAYTNFVGEYTKVWPSMTKVSEVLSGAGVTSFTGIGIYYDDPATVSWTDLRSDVWAVINSQDVGKIINNNSWILVKSIPWGNKVIIEFPLRNIVSYMIGPMKVYPVIEKYMDEKWYKTTVPMIELYDMTAKKIYYIAEITK